MLLEDLYQIVKRGAKEPLVLWLDEFKKMSQKVAPGLKETAARLPEGTAVKADAETLVKLLEEDEPNELELAKSLAHVAELFSAGALPKIRELINNYAQDGRKFYGNAQLSEFSRQARKKLKSALSPQKQKDYDLRLFQQEGMQYCLEFYLAMYKAIEDAPTPEEKKQYIESSEVKLEFGNVPGLWIDFSRDEVLEKFIYSILDDGPRKTLTKSYFSVKNIMMRIKMDCDRQGKRRTDYQGVTLEEVIEAFRQFLRVLLETFQKIGIDRLASYGFKPYGEKPLIKEVELKI